MNWKLSNHHKPLLLSSDDVNKGSRMGGTPPSNISDLTCPACKGKIQYVLSLGEDTLGENAKNKELSFFVWILIADGPGKIAFHLHH
jgi:hypothetical protein